MFNSGKKIRASRDKKINIQTLVLSEKKFRNETKNHFFNNIGNQNIFLEKNHNNPPLQVKWSVPKNATTMINHMDHPSLYYINVVSCEFK
jgi:hypothetical protein